MRGSAANAVQDGQHEAVVDGAEAPGQESEDDEQGQPGERRASDRLDREVGVVAGDHLRAADGRRGREHRGEDGLEPEGLSHLLEGEDDPAERGVEGDGEARATQGGLQHPHLGVGNAGASSGLCSDRRPHVHRRTFAPQHQTRSDRQHPADELRGEQAQQRRVGVAQMNCLHVLDARLPAASGTHLTIRAASVAQTAAAATTTSQPGPGSRCAQSAKSHPQRVRGVQAPPERAADEPDGHARDDRGEADADGALQRPAGRGVVQLRHGGVLLIASFLEGGCPGGWMFGTARALSSIAQEGGGLRSGGWR